MKGRNIITILLLLAVLISNGCLFDPRDPDPPGTGEEDCWVIPHSERDVFENLECGLGATGNSSYERILHPSFTFVPRLEDEMELGSEVFEGWDKDVELEVITRLKGEYQGERKVQFGDENGVFDRESIEVGRAEFEGPYMFVLDRSDGSPPDTLSGKAIFYVEKLTQGWVLKTWEDIDVNGNYSTSGYLRGSLRGSS
ncbi:MAG: hypothetical protein JSV33_09770 [bacterium]|nr:MAG: hypothetical protein JSV33_09770 [bacterium]